MRADQRAALFQFFAGYFHEDWDVDAASADDVIEGFIAEQGDETHRRALADHIDALVDEVGDGDGLERVLEELGCYYLPVADGRSAHDWLRQVGERLRGAAAGRAR